MKKAPLSLLALMLVASTAIAVSKNFPDVPANAWFYGDVQYVTDNSIMNGYGNGNFGPSDNVNRAQLAAVLHRIDAGSVAKMLVELEGARMRDVDAMKGSTWAAYIKNRLRFPVDGIQGANESVINYDFVKNDLVVLAKDKDDNYELLGESGGKGSYFFIKENSDLYGPRVFGAFYDDVSKLIPQVK